MLDAFIQMKLNPKHCWIFLKKKLSIANETES